MYKVLTTDSFDKEFKKLDRSIQKIISKWIKTNLVDAENPRIVGKSLKGTLSGYWRYRIGDYRLLVDIIDDELIIVAISVGHGKKIYDR